MGPFSYCRSHSSSSEEESPPKLRHFRRTTLGTLQACGFVVWLFASLRHCLEECIYERMWIRRRRTGLRHEQSSHKERMGRQFYHPNFSFRIGSRDLQRPASQQVHLLRVHTKVAVVLFSRS